MAQRISRAKVTLRAAGGRFEEPTSPDFPDQLHAVRHVSYPNFNEGYTTSRRTAFWTPTLCERRDESRRTPAPLDPRRPEITGLLALMLLTHARTAARTNDRGDLVPLVEQDRRRCNRRLIGPTAQPPRPRGARQFFSN